MDPIDTAITESNLSDDFYIWGGQCLSVAKAIQTVFGGEIIFVTELPGEGFDHALVEIEGRLYDGSGRVSWSETVSRFVPPETRREEPEDNFYYPDEPVDSFSAAFDNSVYESACQLIKQATDS